MRETRSDRTILRPCGQRTDVSCLHQNRPCTGTVFGFVLEKFHFFLVKVDSLGLGQDKHTGTHDTKAAGIILMMFGLVVIVGSIVRYLQTDAKIRDPNLVVYSTRASTLLGLTLLILGGFMLWAMIAL
jgi:uncharacterized membrane protein YidH (DUF202 family)